MTKLLATTSAAILGAALLASTAQAGEGNYQSIQIEDFAGTITIVTGDYDQVSWDTDDVRIKFDEGRNITFNIDTDRDDVFEGRNGKSLTISSGYESRGYMNCRSNGGLFGGSNTKLKFERGGDWVELEDLPNLTIYAPRDIRFSVQDSVLFGEVGDIRSGSINVDSCGDIKIGDVRDELRLNINGSGDVTAGDIGYGAVKVNGSGDYTFGDVHGEMSVRINGSGDGRFGQIEGDTEIRVNGSGDLRIGEIIGRLDLEVRGSGDVSVGELRGDLEVETNGSGDLSIGEMTGNLSAETNGSGDLSVGRGLIGEMDAEINGSGDMEIDAEVGNLTAELDGSGDMEVRKVTGRVRKSGHGDLEIAGREWKDEG